MAGDGREAMDDAGAVESGRREAILEAALDEFADKGFRGATIKRIAQRARIKSQALIYWYFPTKEALFEAVVSRRLPILQLLIDPGGLLEEPPEEALPRLARAFLAAGDQPAASRIVRLLVPEIIRKPEAIERLGQPVILRSLSFLKAYLDRQVEAGRLRPHDTRASSRAFIGMLLPQLGGKLFFPALRQDGLSDIEHVAAVVAVFLRGLSLDPDAN